MKYLNAEKIKWLVEDNGLFFAPASKQSDQNEGVYDYKKYTEQIVDSLKKDDLNFSLEFNNIMRSLQNIHRDNNFLSCWHKSTNESMDMWDEFGKDGVVIFSDQLTLISNLPSPLSCAVSHCHVQYDDELKLTALYKPLAVKNSKFKNEKEFRIIFDLEKYPIITRTDAKRTVWIDGIPSYENDEITACMSKDAMENGHKVLRKKDIGFVIHYSLNRIIKEVRIHPNATYDELKNLKFLLGKLNLKCTINHSKLRFA